MKPEKCVLLISDLHVSSADFPTKLAKYVSGCARAVREEIGTRNIAAIFYCGDYLDHARYAFEDAALGFVRSINKSFSVSAQNTVLCMGNHDRDLAAAANAYGHSNADYTDKYYECFQKFRRSYYASFWKGAATRSKVQCHHLAGIDILEVDSCSGFSFEENKPAEIIFPMEQASQIVESRNIRHCIVLMHCRPTPSTDGRKTFMRGWTDFIHRCGDRISLACFGDAHTTEFLAIEDLLREQKFLYCGVPSFSKLTREDTPSRGCLLLGLDESNSVVSAVRFFAEFLSQDLDRPDVKWFKDTLQIPKRTSSGADGLPTRRQRARRGKAAKVSQREGRPKQPYKVCDNDYCKMLSEHVLEKNLVLKGLFRVRPDQTSATWIDVEQLLRTKTMLSQVSSHMAKWLEQSMMADINNYMILGVDPNGAMIASRLGVCFNVKFGYTISLARRPFHIEREWEFEVPRSVKGIVLVTDVIATGKGIVDLADWIWKEKRSDLNLLPIGVFLAPRTSRELVASELRRMPLWACLCDCLNLGMTQLGGSDTGNMELDMDLVLDGNL